MAMDDDVTPGRILDDALADLYAAQEADEGALADLEARIANVERVLGIHHD